MGGSTSRLSGAGGLQGPTDAATDEILPVHFFDDSPTNRSIVLATTFRFNDVLDPERLRASLATLLEIGDWKKLGGRLRFNTDKRLEIHVPARFSPERPAVGFSLQTFQVSIEEHPLASRLAKATDRPSLQPGAAEFRAFATPSGSPQSFEDFVGCDSPQLFLHVASFSDATLVSLVFPHLTMDAMGLSELMSAWSLVLAGGERAVPPFLGARTDVLHGVGDATDSNQEPFVLASQRLSGMRFVWFAITFLWELLWLPSADSQSIFLPASFMSRLRQEATSSLKESTLANTVPFLSDGDILTAWITHLSLSVEKRPRPAVIANAFDIRGRLNVFSQSGGAYVQNMTLISYTTLSKQDVSTATVGFLAGRTRATIIQQTAETQVRALIQEYRIARKTAAGAPLYGEVGSKSIFFTNWAKAKLYDITNFSPAILSSGPVHSERDGTRGLLAYYHAQHLTSSGLVGKLDSFQINGKVSSGGYWISGNMSPGLRLRMKLEFE